jgi:hypothetical protein
MRRHLEKKHPSALAKAPTSTPRAFTMAPSLANARSNAIVLRMIICDNIPLAHVRTCGVRQMMQDLKVKNGFMPHRKSTIRQMITYWRDIIRHQIAIELKSTNWISFTQDNWTENGRGYVGITAHYLHENDSKMEMRTRGLAVHPYKGNQTAEMIFNTFKV